MTRHLNQSHCVDLTQLLSPTKCKNVNLAANHGWMSTCVFFRCDNSVEVIL